MSDMKRATPQQRQASDPKSSVWVSANAGSGKTHVLVDRVIRLMLDGVDPASILCITYTKAAAAEMAGRVHRQLGSWVGLSDEELTRHLEHMGRTRIDAEILARARRLFTAALETPGGFKIQTIHAFCERILHLFPIEAGMSPDFMVLDERQTAEFLAASRDAVLLEAQKDNGSDLAQAFQLISKHAQPDAFDALLESMLKQRHGLQQLMEEHGTLAAMGSVLKKKLGFSTSDTVASLRKEFLAMDGVVAREAVARMEVSLKTNQKTAAIYAMLLSGCDPEHAETICRNRFYNSDGTTPLAFSSIVTNTFAALHPHIGDWLSTECDRMANLIGKLDNLARVEATLALTALLLAIVTHFETTKQIRGTHDFDDLIFRTRDLLSDKTAAQWVLYKLDRGFEHVLVDEAQDTSLAQWQIVEALTEEFFSGKGVRDQANRTLFVVGDRKQSIYSFQGADPTAFESTRQRLSRKIRDIEHPFSDVDLTVSYRSTAEVLKAVDTVFAEGTLARVGLAGDVTENLHHETTRSGVPGLFELWPVIVPPEKYEREPWQAPVDREAATSPRRMLAKKIAAAIKSWIGKRHVAGLGRTVQPGDILILFRTRNPLFAIMISELRKCGVPVAGADRLKLSENIAVQDMMALVRFVLMPHDDHSLACILKSPLMPQSLSEQQLFDLAHGRKDSLWDRLRSSPDVACMQAYDRLTQWIEQARKSHPYEFFMAVLHQARKTFLARLGSEAGDALDGLLEAALSFEEQHSTSLSGFAFWFLSDVVEIKRDMESGHGEVRLMTVHGAKGLEASIVILPDTTALPLEQKAGLMFLDAEDGGAKLPFWRLTKLSSTEALKGWKSEKTDAGLEEYRRQLYVAMTRARDELYVCGCLGGNPLPETSWYHMIEEGMSHPCDGKPLLRSVVTANGSQIWRYGADPVFTTEEAAPAVPPLIPPSWLSTLPAYPGSAPTIWTATRLLQGARPVSSIEGAKRGRIIHKILQDVSGKSSEQVAAHIRRMAAKNKLETGLADALISLVSHPDHQVFFGENSQAEVSLGAVLPNGQRFNGVVDRLVVGEKEILLLDFKTDRYIPENLPSDHPYVGQLAAYAVALKQAYGERPIHAALLWTDLPRLDWLAAAELEKGMVAITSACHT